MCLRAVMVKNLPLVKPRNDATEEEEQKGNSFRIEFESKFLKYRGDPRFLCQGDGKVLIQYAIGK